MYQFVLTAHSVTRWLVLVFLLCSVYRAWTGYYKKRHFTKTDNALRHWTATLAHIQLLLGMILYTQSPAVSYFMKGTGPKSGEPVFFGLIHILLMAAAVIVITIGSAKAKRKAHVAEKYSVMLRWFSAALVIIFIAIPWPFSPLAQRPLIR
jgi:hypothetical protein